MSNQILYTALGESITRGTGSSFLYGFVYRFCDYLECKYCDVKCKNLGCPGITSHGLLKQLKKNKETKWAVRNADIITITIGANNLIKCFSDNYNVINSQVAGRWVEMFCEDWPKILQHIRQRLCSDAQIYVMTLYNPIRCNDRNYGLTDYYISQINTSIADPILMQNYGYVVADVYSCFEKNKAKNWTFLYNFIISDPHPNREGNRRIFRTFKDAYKENNFVA